MKYLLTLTLGALLGAGIAVAILYFGAKAGSVTIAVISACVVIWYAVKAVRADREKMRRGRDEVWQRRIDEQPRRYDIADIDTMQVKLWDERRPVWDERRPIPMELPVRRERWHYDCFGGMSHDEYATYRGGRRRPIETIKPEERHGF